MKYAEKFVTLKFQRVLYKKRPCLITTINRKNSMNYINFFSLSALVLAMSACGGNSRKAAEETPSDEASFFESQPLASGIYDATYFDIKGKDSRKGAFDGRVIVSVSPDQNAVFVYENGNRTKIKHLMMLDAPFEMSEGVYSSTSKGLPVTLSPDSVDCRIKYVANGDTVTITFGQKARNTYQPLEALRKIQEEVSK